MKINNELKKLFFGFNLFFFLLSFFYMQLQAQGTWTALKNQIPTLNSGVMVMLLLADGTVMAKTDSIPNDTLGTTTWSKLTPDIHGSYVNGTWSAIASMKYKRLYFSSQVLKDGRVYVGGGENGNGGLSAEMYDPVTNVWTQLPPPGAKISDGNSEILPDGRVLQALVSGTLRSTVIYNPVSNTYSLGPTCWGIHNESAWVKLADSSILFVDRGATSSERYIPKKNLWEKDATVPVSLYDPYGLETGPAFLLPDGRAFYIGSPSVTAYYTPSSTVNPGTWVAGPAIPNNRGIPDGPGAMMVNGKILLILSPTPTSAMHFPRGSIFYEFDYLTNTFTSIKAPDGSDSLPGRTADCNMLDLPDGTVLYSNQGSSQCYVYSPSGTPLAAGKPTISNIISDSTCSTYTITGTLFNGISEGACYGDDWQMSTNRAIIRLMLNSNVYYARTFNWNSTGVQRGSNPDTTQFILPAGMPAGTYSLVVTANGNASDPVLLTLPCTWYTGIRETENPDYNTIYAYPNPADKQVTISFKVKDGGIYTIKILDVLGRTVKQETSEAISGDNTRMINLNDVTRGLYLINFQQGDAVYNTKLLVK